MLDRFDVANYNSLSLVVSVRAVYRRRAPPPTSGELRYCITTVHTCYRGVCYVSVCTMCVCRWTLLVEDKCRLFMEIVIDENHIAIW